MIENYGPFASGAEDQNPRKLQVSIKDLKAEKCKCGCMVFNQGVIIKTVSKLLTGKGEEGIIPVSVFYCIKCKEVVQRFLPAEMRDSNIIS